MISPQKEIVVESKKKERAYQPKSKHAPSRFELKGSLKQDQNFISAHKAEMEKPAPSFSAFLIDQTFIWSLLWAKICILALVTNAHMVRFLDISQMQAPLIMACTYGISWINYRLAFKIVGRATFGQSLK